MTETPSSAAPYAGDLTAQESWDRLSQSGPGHLIDVRTKAEWDFVGLPDLRELGRTLQMISWQVYPQMAVDADFVGKVAATGVRPGEPIYLLCRSGARSQAAAIALTAAGYGPCFNISDGFEGGVNEQSRRGTLAGWKASGLPWVQK